MSDDTAGVGRVAGVTIEVIGIVRDLIGRPEEQLKVPEPATARRALQLLAARHPVLVGLVLEADGCTPNEHYLLCLNGQRFLDDLDEPLPETSRLLLITAMAGGACSSLLMGGP